jgi:hypothetical protein
VHRHPHGIEPGGHDRVEMVLAYLPAASPVATVEDATQVDPAPEGWSPVARRRSLAGDAMTPAMIQHAVTRPGPTSP